MIFFQIIKLIKIYKSKVRQELELRRNKRENNIIIKYNKRNFDYQIKKHKTNSIKIVNLSSKCTIPNLIF